MIEICASYDRLAGSYGKRVELALKHRIFKILKLVDINVVFHGRHYDRVSVQSVQSRCWLNNGIIPVDARGMLIWCLGYLKFE
jgi:hypothetical protein